MSLDDNKLVVVTSPDYYHADQPSLMLYDVDSDDIKLIVEVLMQADIQMSLHLSYSHKSEREWIINTARMCDRVIVNLEKHDLIKGYILNHKHVSYYNSDNDIKSLNINEIIDPLDYVMRFINERRKQELNL